MRLPNFLALFVSCLLLSANVGADYDKGSAAYETGDYETTLPEWAPLAECQQAILR